MDCCTLCALYAEKLLVRSDRSIGRAKSLHQETELDRAGRLMPGGRHLKIEISVAGAEYMDASWGQKRVLARGKNERQVCNGEYINHAIPLLFA